MFWRVEADKEDFYYRWTPLRKILVFAMKLNAMFSLMIGYLTSKILLSLTLLNVNT